MDTCWFWVIAAIAVVVLMAWYWKGKKKGPSVPKGPIAPPPPPETPAM